MKITQEMLARQRKMPSETAPIAFDFNSWAATWLSSVTSIEESPIYKGNDRQRIDLMIGHFFQLHEIIYNYQPSEEDQCQAAKHQAGPTQYQTQQYLYPNPHHFPPAKYYT